MGSILLMVVAWIFLLRPERAAAAASLPRAGDLGPD
jgi:hypothetical protein